MATAYQPPTWSPQPLSNLADQPGTVAKHDPYELFRQQNQAGTSEDIVRNAYKYFTGREADAPGLKAHMGNPGGLEGAVRSIYGSPEATAYGKANPNAWKPPSATQLPVIPNAPSTPANVRAQILQGFTPKHAMEGFDFRREQNTGKSAKDAFAYLSNQAPPPPINDKAALGAWFKQYIEPGMNALGHRIISVDGDKFRFANWQGQFDVDYGRGAGAEGGALAWQVDDGTAQMGTSPYTPVVIDPQTGQPIQSSTTPISSAIAYRRPYQSDI